jgi:hypothetical protein
LATQQFKPNPKEHIDPTYRIRKAEHTNREAVRRYEDYMATKLSRQNSVTANGRNNSNSILRSSSSRILADNSDHVSYRELLHTQTAQIPTKPPTCHHCSAASLKTYN